MFGHTEVLSARFDSMPIMYRILKNSSRLLGEISSTDMRL